MKDEIVAHSLPTSDMTVAEVLEYWPETVSVFQDFKTACVGCVMAPFDTMSDVARIYQLELSEIIEALHRAVKMADQDGGPATD